MNFSFIAERVAEKKFPVRAMCRVLGVTPSGYYAWRKRPKSERERDDEVLGLEVAAAHAKSKGIYGSPRITEVLKAQGRSVSRKRVARKMREAGLRGRKRRPFKATTDSKGSRNVPSNLLRRDFTASAPNRVWVTDVTAVYTGTGWLYLAAILDVFSRAVRIGRTKALPARRAWSAGPGEHRRYHRHERAPCSFRQAGWRSRRGHTSSGSRPT